MTYRLVQFGSTLLPDYNEEFDIGRAVTKKAALDIPTGGALDLFGGERIQPGARTLTNTCTLHSTTESGLMNAYQTLATLVGTRAKLYRKRISDGSWFWAWARFDKLTATRKYSGGSSRYFQDVSLTFTVFTPAWYSMDEEEYWISAEAGDEDDLTTCGVEGDYVMLTLVLGGDNLPQPNVVFEILATSMFTHVEVVNTTNGYIWLYDGTVHIGETLVVDCGEMSVLNNGVDDYAHFYPPSDRERWFELQPNNNRVSIAVDGDADIYIHFLGALA